MKYILAENREGFAGKIVYTIYLDRDMQKNIGNILVPFSGNKYELYFSDEQTAYTPKKAVRVSCWGAVIRCINNAIDSMEKGGAA